jgi:hypothetical protein
MATSIVDILERKAYDEIVDASVASRYIEQEVFIWSHAKTIMAQRLLRKNHYQFGQIKSYPEWAIIRDISY